MMVWTIGHSTRSIDEFLTLLRVYEIRILVDVRRFPFSRRYPQFNRDQLHKSLISAGIEYVGLPELGGRRQTSPGSQNTAWRNLSFRGYADYMETEGFRMGIGVLMELIRRSRTALMCAEALWWKCHRSLIADYLKTNGVCVRHIIDKSTSESHPYTAAAHFKNGKLSYNRGKLI